MVSNSDFIGCAQCGEVVCKLDAPRFVTHKSIGCALVIELGCISGSHYRLAHPEGDNKTFKCGKLRCGQCNENWGNVQNNVKTPPFEGMEVGMLKLDSMVFVFHEDGKSERRKLTGNVLRSAFCQSRTKVSELTLDLIRQHGTLAEPLAADVGTQVRLWGLVKAAQYNARRGVISKVNEEGDRFVVLLDGQEGLQLSLKRSNICVESPKNRKEPPARESPESIPGAFGSSEGASNSSKLGKGILKKYESERAIIKTIFQDKNGNLVGFCALRRETRSAAGGQDPGDIFLFHGAEAEDGLKTGCGAGSVESAGLQLEAGDVLGELRVQAGPKGLKLVSATLVDLSCHSSSSSRLTNYLLSLEKAVADLRRRGSALQCLRQQSACIAILNAVAALPDPTESVISLLEVLVQASCPGSGSSGKTSIAALETVLASKLTLPDQHLEKHLQGTVSTDKKLRARLVGVVLQAFRFAPRARRRLFILLSAFLHASPSEAQELLPPERLVPLLAVSLPEDEQLGCYHWRELPLHLLPAEMRAQGVLSSKRDDLHAVKTQGAYRDFEQYMDTYVGLLREEAFAGMRQGLSDLLTGKLDSRDMLVLSNATLLAMSPPSTAGGGSAEGTVLELRAKSACSSPPMFGSLLAVAPGLSFDRQAVWATVAGATYNPKEKELCLYAELCAGLNEGADSQILVGLLRNSGNLTIVESPTFYRAYAPAISALQDMQLEHMPFAQEILYGTDSGAPGLVAGILVDPSTAFQEVAARGETIQLPLASAVDFISALDHLVPRSRPAMPQQPKELVADVGTRVRVFGLVNAAQYNGRRGVINKVIEEGERFLVLLEMQAREGQLLSLKRKNICVENDTSRDSHGQSPHVQAQPNVRLCGIEVTTTLDPSQCEALKAVLTRRIAIIRGPPGTGKTFIGVRALRLLLSAVEDDSEDVGSVSAPGPALLLTYKNVALDDFLKECVGLWPDEVARIGGKAEGVLEQRHLGALLRNARRTDEHMAARNLASEKREEVEAATQAMARQRFFSAESLLEACSGNCDARWGCAACRFLGSLLLHDPTSSEADRAAASAELLSKKRDLDALLRRVSGVIRVWVPSKKECAKICRSGTAVSDDQDARLATQGGAASGAGQSEEAEQERQERSRYSWFENSAVRLDQEPSAASGCRMVFELATGEEMAETEASELLSTENVWDLKGERRVRCMHALVRSLFSQAAARYDAAMETYSLAAETLRGLEVRHQADVLQGMKVVGMTISGASIQRDLLAVLKPRIVFVEEAGEVLEPLLLAALGPWVQRLVLIGDDKQLPPQVNSHTLARDFHFNTSLMLRLINNKLPHQSLSFQARMMPEFAALLTDVYPEYKTSDRVFRQDRQSPPPGVVPAMFFWDVESAVPEEDSSGRSHINRSEVDCVTALAVHLVRSGVAPKRITLLAPYAGQVQALRERVRGPLAAVHQGGWPKQALHGVAAADQLKTLSDQVGTGIAGTGAGQQCMSVAETMLKLGRIEDAQRAYMLVTKCANHDVQGGAGPELFTAVSKQLERIRMLIKSTDDVEKLLGGQVTAVELNDAISAIKALEEVWTRWRASSVAAAAAAAHRQSELAVKIRDAASAVPGKGLNDKQRRLIDAMSRSANERLAELASQEEVCVCSIDRYQGSENDYVIVSLVRCNSFGDIGFLRERARRVVAQSRARLGMYFVGSRRTMEKSEHWRWLCEQMKARKSLGHALQLTCPKHGGGCRDVSARTEDLTVVIERGVCGQECGALMGCGIHRCKLRCHGDSELAIQRHLVCEVMMDDFCRSGNHTIRRKCAESAADVKCSPCQRIEGERLEREKRERDARAKAEREAAERLVQESRRIEKAERERKLEEQQVLEQQQKAEVDRIIAEIKLRPQGLRKETLQPHGEHAQDFLSVKDRTEKYVQASHGSLTVLRIEKVINYELEGRFLEAKRQLHSGIINCNMQQLFHGTGKEGVEGIPRTGFRLPPQSEDNMFGRGIYFATDSSKSAQHMYTKGSGCVLLCDVLIGKSCEVKGLASPSPLSRFVKKSSKGRPFLDVDEAKMKPTGFDSVFAPRGTRETQGVLFDEMIVYNPAQAIPRYIVHFSNGASKPHWSSPGQPVAGAHSVSVRTIYANSLKRSLDSRELYEFNFACGNFFRLIGGSGSRPVTVAKVDVYDSVAVKKAHQEKEDEFRQQGKSTAKRWVFHGTPQSSNVSKICSEGFKVGGSNGVPIANGAAYGNGVYTAIGPKTPMNYSRANSSIILCSGLLGKEKRSESDMGFDSWPGPPDQDWMIFKTAEQLLPQYVVHLG